MLGLAVSILGLAVLLAISNWRLGIYAAIAMAFLQDPMRKLTTGEPSYFMLNASESTGSAPDKLREQLGNVIID